MTQDSLWWDLLFLFISFICYFSPCSSFKSGVCYLASTILIGSLDRHHEMAAWNCTNRLFYVCLCFFHVLKVTPKYTLITNFNLCISFYSIFLSFSEQLPSWLQRSLPRKYQSFSNCISRSAFTPTYLRLPTGYLSRSITGYSRLILTYCPIVFFS